MKNKKDTNNYVVTFPLETEKWQEDLLERSLHRVYDLHNKTTKIILDTLKREEEKINAVKSIMKKISSYPSKEKRTDKQNEEIKQLFEEINQILDTIKTHDIPNLKRYPTKNRNLISKYGLYDIINMLLYDNIGGKDENGNDLTFKSYFPPIDTTVTCEECNKVWRSLEDYLFHGGKEIHLKKQSEFNTFGYAIKERSKACTIEKDVTSKKFYLVLTKNKKTVKIPIKVKNYGFDGFEYEQRALHSKIVKITIKRDKVRGKYKYYVQLTVKGTPFNKGRMLGDGVVGIDPGTRHITCYGKTVRQYTSSVDISKLRKKKKKLQQDIDRSRRIYNPNKYNDDGTIKKGNKEPWKITKNCRKKINEVKEIERKIEAKREIDQYQFVNSILCEGNEFHYEKTDMKSLSKRSKGVRYNKDGTCKSNKRYGKSIGDIAPSSLISKLEGKVKFLGGTWVDINQKDARATGTDHTRFGKSNNFNDYTKDEYYTKIKNGYAIKLSNDMVHDRDSHSAFNLKHFNNKTKSYNINEMNEDYSNFVNAEKDAFERHELDADKLLKYQSTI